MAHELFDYRSGVKRLIIVKMMPSGNVSPCWIWMGSPMMMYGPAEPVKLIRLNDSN